MFNKKHLALLTDFYELTMGRGYFHSDMRDRIAYFDVFFRQNPDSGGYSIVCGLERICRYLQNLSTTSKPSALRVTSGRSPREA